MVLSPFGLADGLLGAISGQVELRGVGGIYTSVFQVAVLCREGGPFRVGLEEIRV